MINDILLVISLAVFGADMYFVFDLIRSAKGDKEVLLWKSISVALITFLVIFCFYTYSSFKGHASLSIPPSVIIYFIGAAFVLFIVRFAGNMVETLKNNEKRFKDLNFKLEYETTQKARELENKVKELEDSRSAMINILEDISEQKNSLESAKIQADKLNMALDRTNRQLLELDQQKDQFTSIAAHELKTPLASIHGFVQLLQNKKVFENQAQREKYMQIIIQDTDRLSKLITDILDISRMDLGTLKFYFEEIKTKMLITELEKEMSSIIRAKNLSSLYKISGDVPDMILTDKNRLLQVLSNLVSNAVHYTEDGGRITLEVRRIGENELLFSVSDTGIGISKDEQEKLFRRFYQVDNWLTRKIGGSGLGLAICKGIVTALGGKIWVESETGKGSTFYFTTPVKAELKGEGEDKYEKYMKVFETDLKEKGFQIKNDAKDIIKEALKNEEFTKGEISGSGKIDELKKENLIEPIGKKVEHFFD